MVTIREAVLADHEAIWQIMHQVISAGDTYTFDPQTPRAEVLAYWFQRGSHAFVAEHEGRLVGTYVVKANQPGLGSHVANAAFMVSRDARGKCLADERHRRGTDAILLPEASARRDSHAGGVQIVKVNGSVADGCWRFDLPAVGQDPASPRRVTERHRRD